jgi:uncharacterized protein (DUF2236 family)
MANRILPQAHEWKLLATRPGAITRERASDSRLVLAAGYALLLQVSHPTVGAGVSEHSQFRRDPWGRLLRTLDYTYTMVYGGARDAGEMGRRIRLFHRRIAGFTPDGSRYHALEPEAYAWVHATLAEAIVLGHERFGRPFTAQQRERLWAEWRALGRLLGVRERDLPEDWVAFRGYFAQMVHERLEHTAAVDEVLEALVRPAPPELRLLRGPAWATVRPPMAHTLRLTTAGLLAPELRRRFQVRWSHVDELELRALSVALRAATPVMPPPLRNTGPGYLRWRKRALANGDAQSRSARPMRR